MSKRRFTLLLLSGFFTFGLFAFGSTRAAEETAYLRGWKDALRGTVPHIERVSDFRKMTEGGMGELAYENIAELSDYTYTLFVEGKGSRRHLEFWNYIAVHFGNAESGFPDGREVYPLAVRLLDLAVSGNRLARYALRESLAKESEIVKGTHNRVYLAIKNKLYERITSHEPIETELRLFRELIAEVHGSGLEAEEMRHFAERVWKAYPGDKMPPGIKNYLSAFVPSPRASGVEKNDTPKPEARELPIESLEERLLRVARFFDGRNPLMAQGTPKVRAEWESLSSETGSRIYDEIILRTGDRQPGVTIWAPSRQKKDHVRGWKGGHGFFSVIVPIHHDPKTKFVVFFGDVQYPELRERPSRPGDIEVEGEVDRYFGFEEFNSSARAFKYAIESYPGYEHVAEWLPSKVSIDELIVKYFEVLVYPDARTVARLGFLDEQIELEELASDRNLRVLIERERFDEDVPMPEREDGTGRLVEKSKTIAAENSREAISTLWRHLLDGRTGLIDFDSNESSLSPKARRAALEKLRDSMLNTSGEEIFEPEIDTVRNLVKLRAALRLLRDGYAKGKYYRESIGDPNQEEPLQAKLEKTTFQVDREHRVRHVDNMLADLEPDSRRRRRATITPKDAYFLLQSIDTDVHRVTPLEFDHASLGGGRYSPARIVDDYRQWFDDPIRRKDYVPERIAAPFELYKALVFSFRVVQRIVAEQSAKGVANKWLEAKGLGTAAGVWAEKPVDALIRDELISPGMDPRTRAMITGIRTGTANPKEISSWLRRTGSRRSLRPAR